MPPPPDVPPWRLVVLLRRGQPGLPVPSADYRLLEADLAALPAKRRLVQCRYLLVYDRRARRLGVHLESAGSGALHRAGARCYYTGQLYLLPGRAQCYTTSY